MDFWAVIFMLSYCANFSIYEMKDLIKAITEIINAPIDKERVNHLSKLISGMVSRYAIPLAVIE